VIRAADRRCAAERSCAAERERSGDAALNAIGGWMDIALTILNAGLSFLALFLIFRPLEVNFAADKAQRFFRPGWWTDFFYMMGQYLFFNGAVFWVLQRSEKWVYVATPGRVREMVHYLSLWQQAIVVVLLGDLLIYWGHRLQHRVGFLWRFHCIH